ncbi:MAG: sugar transferase [Sedimentisphaerales bacterium]|nr:sugar transferase [Sedimentisphaerales bacterium]
MNLIIVHRNISTETHIKDGTVSLLKFALTDEVISGVVLDGLSKCLSCCRKRKAFYAVPEEWQVDSNIIGLNKVSYFKKVPIRPDLLRKIKNESWLAVSNAQFVTRIDAELLDKLLTKNHADIIAINVEPELSGKQEKMRLTAQNKIAGFRRLYYDSAHPVPLCENWPHHLFIKTGILEQLLVDGSLPQMFSTILEKGRSSSLKPCGINVGGIVFDLETQEGLLNFCGVEISNIRNSELGVYNSNTMPSDSKIVGKVLLGKNVNIGPKTIIIGPTIIGNNVTLGQGTIINSAIIGSETFLPQDKFIRDNVLVEPPYEWKLLSQSIQHKKQTYRLCKSDHKHHNKRFRYFSRFSYPGSIKRIADIFAALIVLILFAPIIPFIAMAIKLTSPGPVFFKHKRQGRYGKMFNCLKFRTMKLGADKMQDKLRFISQVDGPQFKMADDPRISAAGRFLRETYLDEIPQFLNVLLGHMSIVGPRPSPESENTLCPFWRDARLSVRPGITGLWQICRTRRPMKDFQEWIHYDTEYVRNLSLKMDLWISWKTTKKLLDNFINQF